MEVAKDVVLYKGGKGGNLRKFKRSRQMRKLIKMCTKAEKVWRKAVINSQVNVMQNWQMYMEWQRRVRVYKKRIEGRRSMKWRVMVVKEGGLSSKMLWSEMNRRSEELKAVQEDGRVVTDRSEVESVVVRFFTKLGTFITKGMMREYINQY